MARALIRAALAAAVLAGAGCVEPFDGSKLEILFANGVPLPGQAAPGAPPEGTHLELYAVRDSVPIHVASFSFAPAIDRANPCLTEPAGSRAPLSDAPIAGVHLTRYYDKLVELYSADGTVSDAEAGVLAVARERTNDDLPAIEANIHAVVSTSFGPDGGDLTAAELDALEAALPPIDAMDDAANAQRLAACEAFFAAHPNWYVGWDRPLTAPLSGTLFGVADGADPRSGGFIGGASMDVAARLSRFDALRLNWQFDDPADPRAEMLGRSPSGYHFMAGTPESRARRVINVSLRNDAFQEIAAEIAIFTDLDDHSVGF